MRWRAKHGPLALITEKTPVVALATCGKKIQSNIKEVKPGVLRSSPWPRRGTLTRQGGKQGNRASRDQAHLLRRAMHRGSAAPGLLYRQ